MVILMFLVLLLAIILMWYISRSFWFVAAFSAIILLPAFMFWINTGRVLTLSENGCEIRFLWYKRFYCWEDFQEKKIEDYQNSFGHLSPYEGGIVLSSKKYRRSLRFDPAYYGMLRPFTFVYIYFRPKILPNPNPYPMVFAVDEEEILTKFKEWGIDLKKD